MLGQKIYLSQQLPLFLKKQQHETSPMVPISMRLNEYSKHYGLQNVTGLPKIYVILAQYCGHYFSASGCKPDQNETRCEG